MRRMRVLPLALLLCGAITAGAQSFGTINGRLLDEQGEPLPFADVSAEQGGSRYLAQSDIDGRFALKPLPPGTYTVRVVAFNVDRSIEGVLVSGDNITTLGTIAMRNAQDLPDVLVEKSRWEAPLIDPDNTGVTKIFHKQFENNPNKVSPVQLIANFAPGVFKPLNGDGLFFRGSRSENMCYFVDGVKLGDRLSAVPNDAINSFSVYTGGLPAKYGDVTGGVVAIETKSYFDLWQQRNAGIR